MKKMKPIKRFIAAPVMVFMLLSLAACDTGIVGNGNVESRTEEVGDFSRLVISGNFDVHIQQGEKTALSFELDENLYDILQVRESGRTLNIETEVNIIRAKNNDIYLTVKDIEKLDLSGAIDLDGKGVIKAGSLVIVNSGAVQLDLELQANRIRMDLSGAADCNLVGKTGELEVTLSGAGDLNAMDMLADEVRLDLSGAGHARVYAADDLDVSISGVGSVRYRGDPARINKNISGLGSLKKD